MHSSLFDDLVAAAQSGDTPTLARCPENLPTSSGEISRCGDLLVLGWIRESDELMCLDTRTGAPCDANPASTLPSHSSTAARATSAPLDADALRAELEAIEPGCTARGWWWHDYLDMFDEGIV